MTNLAELDRAPVLKALSVGYPTSGKSGAIASVMNTGRYKLRILDYDGKTIDPLLIYVKPEFHKNIDVVRLQDPCRLEDAIVETIGKPTAFRQAWDLLSRWAYTKPDGEKVDLGRPKDWGADHIISLDSLTNQGPAAMNWTLYCRNRVGQKPKWEDWMAAENSMEAFVQLMMSRETVGCHAIINTHFRLIGPPAYVEKEDDAKKKDKDEIRNFVPYKLFPSALGAALPPKIGNHCPFILRFETQVIAGRVRRVIRTVPNLEYDGVAVPLVGLPDELRIEDGLRTIFEAVEAAKSGTVAANKKEGAIS